MKAPPGGEIWSRTFGQILAPFYHQERGYAFTPFQGSIACKDSYLDMIEMGARNYDPRIGRWLSADSIVPNPSNPQSLNRYSYVLNSPLKYIDPTGHQEEPWWKPVFEFTSGAVTQFVNDMGLGIPEAIVTELYFQDALDVVPADYYDNEAFQNGRELGRAASTVVAVVEIAEGVGIIVGVAIGGGVATVASTPTGPGVVVVAGVAVAAEAVAIAEGGALITHGVGVLGHNANAPLYAKGRGSSGRFTTNSKLARRKFDLSKRQFGDAIHDIKYGVEGNPDMLFDLETGDVIDQRSGEIVGNLLDYK
jgi:RHS repeat-associated protein